MSTRQKTLTAFAVVAVAALALTGCTSSDAPAESSGAAAPADSASFPVTIPNAYGDTIIDVQPTNVVTWGWGAADASIALGVVPVAIPFQSYGGDESGVLPWIQDAVTEQGAELPTVLSNSGDEPPYEEIAAAAPDVILAPYSGVTAEQYALLSDIAPTVAFPEEAWATPWRDVVTITGEALGKQAEAEQVLADIDSTIAAKAAEHPEFEGKSIAMTWDSAGTFYVYTPADPRVEFAEDLGFVSAPSVEELDTGESTFYYTLSYEKLDQLTSDILVSFADDEELQQTFLDSSQAKAMQQVKDGTVAQVNGAELIASVSPPTALSLTWGLDAYVDALSEAVAAAE